MPGHNETVGELADVGGVARKNSGMTSTFANTNTNIERSQMRKLPLTVIAISATAAIGTAT